MGIDDPSNARGIGRRSAPLSPQQLRRTWRPAWRRSPRRPRADRPGSWVSAKKSAAFFKNARSIFSSEFLTQPRQLSPLGLAQSTVRPPGATCAS